MKVSCNDDIGSLIDSHKCHCLYKKSILVCVVSLSGEPDYFGRNEISSGGDLSHYSSASLY